MADLLVRSAILADDDDPEFISHLPITLRMHKLLGNPAFKTRLSKQLTTAKKNISGAAADNLRLLYQHLGLHTFALEKLNNKQWHIKAKAIQELGVMEQKNALNKIYRYTNTKNEYVRMEAQTAVVKLFGFEGLRFLDVISTPLAEWQQIKLLHELAQLPPMFFSGIEKWLESENQSVVIFALKLAKNYHRFELYEQVVACLNHTSPEVRLEAILALEKLYNENTSKVLLTKFRQETIKNKKNIVTTVQQIGYEADIVELISLLSLEDVELTRLIVRAIANLDPNGIKLLYEDEISKTEPLPQIINQIEGELK